MDTARQETVRAIQAVAKAAVEEMGRIYDESVGIHINWGESEDRMRGFNDGYDAADPTVSAPSTPELNAPSDEPWRSAYLDAYKEGFDFKAAEDAGELEDIDYGIG